MVEILDFLIDFIRLDIFLGFGYYSIIYFLIRWFFKEKTFIDDFDKSAVQLMIYGGILWFILWLILILVCYFQLDDGTDKTQYFNRMFGKYWFGIWIQPLFWLFISQLYRFNYIKKYLVFRIIISLLFVITFERFIIMVTSLHRDFLPDNLSFFNDLEISTSYLFLGLIGKILVFIIVAILFHYAKNVKKLVYN